MFSERFSTNPLLYLDPHRSFSSGHNSEPKPKWPPSAVKIRFSVLETHPALNSLCTRSRAQHMWLSHADHPRGFIGSNLTPHAKGGAVGPGRWLDKSLKKSFSQQTQQQFFCDTNLFDFFPSNKQRHAEWSKGRNCSKRTRQLVKHHMIY